jgi:SIR2-like domain
MKKKKLLVVVGAGASVEFDVPSVKDVDALFDQIGGEEYPLADGSTSNLYRHIRDAIDTYYEKNPREKLRKRTNFEEVMYQINLLISYTDDPNFSLGSKALVQALPLPDVLAFGRPTSCNADVLRRLNQLLINGLVDRLIDVSAAATTYKASEIAQLHQFFTALSNEFELGFITLNYDNIITQALPNLYTGFNSDGHFDPNAVFARTEWGFIYHLHGSVHFAMTGSASDLHRITWRSSPSKDSAAHADGRNTQSSIEGITFPTSPVIAGYGKTQQILRQPFRTYLAQANRLALEADSFLFLGYGFSDLHLNAVFSEIRDRIRPVVVVDFAEDDQDALAYRQDTWSTNLLRTIPTVGNFSRPGCVAAEAISDLKADREFEVSNNSGSPLAVWYNGMLEACRDPDKVLSHLRGSKS